MRPNRSTVASTAAWHDSASVMSRRERQGLGGRASATSSATASHLLDGAGAEGDVGAVLGEEQRDVAAHARADARDERDLPVDQTGDCSPMTSSAKRSICSTYSSQLRLRNRTCTWSTPMAS